MRICSDGFVDLNDQRRVRTPGEHSLKLEPLPFEDALVFLFSHTFPGNRKVVRGLSEELRRRLRLAMWADSVGERMAMVDRIWRAVSAPVTPPPNRVDPTLLQIIRVGPEREFHLFLVRGSTQVRTPQDLTPGGEAGWWDPSRARQGQPREGVEVLELPAGDRG